MDSHSDSECWSELSAPIEHHGASWEILSEGDGHTSAEESIVSIPHPTAEDVISIGVNSDIDAANLSSDDEHDVLYPITSISNHHDEKQDRITTRVHTSAMPHHVSAAPNIDQILETEEVRPDHTLIPSYIDIQAELTAQTALVEQLRAANTSLNGQLDEAQHEVDTLRRQQSMQVAEISRLQTVNVRIDRQNQAYRNMALKKRRSIDRNLDATKSKYSKTKKGRTNQRRGVPAKLRFRQQRTTHRSVYANNSRKW